MIYYIVPALGFCVCFHSHFSHIVFIMCDFEITAAINFVPLKHA